jgi:DNA-binding transcriptional regulator YdaS (Cro superfamily)
MELRHYLKTLSRDDRKAFAERIGTTVGHLNNMASGCSPISPRYAAQIEIATEGAVPRSESRPEDWHLIWPPNLRASTPSANSDPASLSRESLYVQTVHGVEAALA